MAVAYQTSAAGMKPAGFDLFDISTPENPKLISHFDASGPHSRGVHAVWFVDGEYVHMASGAPDFQPTHPSDDQFYRIVDVRNPSKPAEVGRWWLPGTRVGDNVSPPPRHPKFDSGFRAHNTNVFPQRPDRAYIGYISGGAVILDIADKSRPKLVAHWRYSPPYTGFTHTVLPLFERELLIVSDECGAGLVALGQHHRRDVLRRRRAGIRREQPLPAAGDRLLRAPRAQALARRVDPAERRLRGRPPAGVRRGPLRGRLVRPRDDDLMQSPAPTRDPLAGKLPVSLITGFLGSGKTTLLRHLLRDPGMNRAAVIINEFGEVGIDHELVASSSENMTLLSNGCLCCTVRTDLQETLRELFIKRRAGEVIDFDRVFIETTGLADPVPVLHTLQTDGMLGAQYRLDCVVTLVDAVNGLQNLDDTPEAAKQAAVADRIVITKSDIAPPAAVATLEARLQQMNPYAARTVAINGEVDVGFLRDIGPRSTRATPKDLDRWLAPSGEARPAEGAYLGERVRSGAHDASIRSFCLWFDKPFTWDTFSAAVQVLTSLRGTDLLRVKGLVNVAGESGPVVVQGAQHVFHPPVTLEAWSGTDRRSRIVFITRNLSRESVEALFAAVGTLAAPRA